jgi:iron complex transport system permease protein
MHFDHGEVPLEYTRYTWQKSLFIFMLFLSLVAAIVVSISLGSVKIGIYDIINTLMRQPGSRQLELII